MTRVGVMTAHHREAGGISQYSLMVLRALSDPMGEHAPDFTLYGVPADDPAAITVARAGWRVADSAVATETGRSQISRVRALARAAVPALGRNALRGVYDAIRPRRVNVRRMDHPVQDGAAEARLRADGVDLLFAPMPFETAVETTIPTVMAMHDVHHRRDPHFPEFDDDYWATTEYICRQAARRGTVLIADSEVGREDLLECYRRYGLTAERVRVVPYAVPPYINAGTAVSEVARVRRRHDLPERYLFYPAQFWPHKNHARLIEALGRLRTRAGLRIPLVLVGSASQPLTRATLNNAHQTASRVGVAEQVRWLGYVDDEDIVGLYGGAAALVMPTLFGPTNIPIVEAWTLGVPVLTTKARGHGDMCGDAARLFGGADTDAMAEAIRDVWLHPEDFAGIVRNGLARAAARSPARFREGLWNALGTALERIPPVITFFTLPRAFAGDTGVRQHNAIASWMRLVPRCEVLLFGDDPGIAEAAAEHGAVHLPAVERNARGTPLLDGPFSTASAVANRSLVCFVNADILLYDDFIRAARSIPFARYVMAGARLGVDAVPGVRLDAAGMDQLREVALARGAWVAPHGSDYFLYPRGTIARIPPFAVGRVNWDNWMMYHARQMGVPLVDATRTVVAVHQDHDYSHVGHPPTLADDGPEGAENLALGGGYPARYLLIDATHVLTPAGPRRALSRAHLAHRFRRLARRVVPTWLVPPRSPRNG